MKKVLILGGGFGGVETFRQLHKRIHPAHHHNIRVELISQTNFFTFSPMLHEAATGSVAREHVVQPIREILTCCGRDFHQATVEHIDLANQVVQTNVGDHYYDTLVIALGVEQGFFGTPGAAEHALALKWLPGAVAIRNRIIRSFETASELSDIKDRQSMEDHLHFIIVGGGATGTEMAGQLSDLLIEEMKEFYGDVPHSATRITLVHAGPRLLEQLSPKHSENAKKRLEELGVKVMCNEIVTEVTPDGVKLKSGTFLPSRNVLWTAGTESTLKNLMSDRVLNERGLLKVLPTFQLLEHPNVFALGDCATVLEKEYSYPPLAQAATQAAKVVAHNVLAQAEKRELIKKKYASKGNVIPIGDWFALFERGSLKFSGKTAWLIRRAAFLKAMYGWGNRLQVVSDWIINIFLPRDTSEM